MAKLLPRKTRIWCLWIVACSIVAFLNFSKLLVLLLQHDREHHQTSYRSLYDVMSNSLSQNETKPNTMPHRINDKLNTSDCGELEIPKDTVESQFFQRIVDSDEMYIFSAFYEKGRIRCLGEAVRIVSLFCRLWYRSRSMTDEKYLTKTVPAVSEIFHRDRFRYIDVFVFCPLPDASVPYSVSLISTKCGNALNTLRILNHPYEHRSPKNFTVCLSPFNFEYGRAFELIEWMELNQILGAEHFIFYNYSIKQNVNKVLNMYSRRGLAEVVQWPLPMKVQTWPVSVLQEIRYFGQVLALNDCLYRNKLRSKYIVNLDLDEFIIPRQSAERTWSEILSRQPKSDIYSFRNTFFRKDWPTNCSSTNLPLQKDVTKFRLVTLSKCLRESTIFPAYERSKYIARTKNVDSIFVHNVLRTKNDSKHVVPISDGLLHHYRNLEEPGINKDSVTDTTILKYKHSLISKVKDSLARLPGIPMEMPFRGNAV